MAEVQPANHLRALARQRAEFLRANGYVLLKTEGAWGHPSGDRIATDKIVVTRERNWPALRDWIARQSRDVAEKAEAGTGKD